MASVKKSQEVTRGHKKSLVTWKYRVTPSMSRWSSSSLASPSRVRARRKMTSRPSQRKLSRILLDRETETQEVKRVRNHLLANRLVCTACDWKCWCRSGSWASMRLSSWCTQRPSSVMLGLKISRMRNLASPISITSTEKASSSGIIINSRPTMKAVPWQ